MIILKVLIELQIKYEKQICLCKTILEEFNGIYCLFSNIVIISENHVWKIVEAYPWWELYSTMSSQDNGKDTAFKIFFNESTRHLHGMSKHKAGLWQEKNLLCILAKYVASLFAVFHHLSQRVHKHGQWCIYSRIS